MRLLVLSAALLLFACCPNTQADEPTPSETALVSAIESIDKLPEQIASTRYYIENQEPLLVNEYLSTVSNNILTANSELTNITDPKLSTVQQALDYMVTTCYKTVMLLTNYRTDRSLRAQLSQSQASCSKAKDNVIVELEYLVYN